MVDALAVDSIRRAAADNALVVIDEIGPMELFSVAFCNAVMDVLQSDARVLGTIVHRRHPFADRIKALPNVKLHEVTIENRDTMAEDILNQLKGNQP